METNRCSPGSRPRSPVTSELHKFTVASLASRRLDRMFPELARSPLPGHVCHNPKSRRSLTARGSH
jgi:hypothetical protein